jgi:hypothetical protein
MIKRGGGTWIEGGRYQSKGPELGLWPGPAIHEGSNASIKSMGSTGRYLEYEKHSL